MRSAMARQADRTISGHVFKREGKRGGVWYAKYRLPDGRQVQTRIGPHWADRKQRSRPPAASRRRARGPGWTTRSPRPAGASCRAWSAPGATFAAACDDWLDYKRDRKIKLSTQIDYEHMVDRMKKVFGEKFGDEAPPGGGDRRRWSSGSATPWSRKGSRTAPSTST